jgi:hypothetical protein
MNYIRQTHVYDITRKGDNKFSIRAILNTPSVDEGVSDEEYQAYQQEEMTEYEAAGGP